MKMFLISDNIDTQLGMRLAGIEGIVVHEADEVESALRTVMSDKSVGIVLMTAKLVELCRKSVYDIKLNVPRPLIVEIPDRHGAGNTAESISKYIKDAIGVTI